MTKKQIEKEVDKIKKQVAKNYKPEKVILFGSVARGDYSEDSDIDMLIVKQTSERRIDRIKRVLLSVDYSLPFEPLVYTPSELKERQRLGDHFILQALKEGKVLYEQKK